MLNQYIDQRWHIAICTSEINLRQILIKLLGPLIGSWLELTRLVCSIHCTINSLDNGLILFFIKRYIRKPSTPKLNLHVSFWYIFSDKFLYRFTSMPTVWEKNNSLLQAKITHGSHVIESTTEAIWFTDPCFHIGIILLNLSYRKSLVWWFCHVPPLTDIEYIRAQGLTEGTTPCKYTLRVWN